jgi:hypothetical protein
LQIESRHAEIFSSSFLAGIITEIFVEGPVSEIKNLKYGIDIQLLQ